MKLCPMTKDGAHKIALWQSEYLPTRGGKVCVKCHRTWTFQGKQLVPTWPDA